MKVVLIVALLLSQSPGIRASASRWRPAVFRTLTVGKSKRVDMLRALGKPKWSRVTPGAEDDDPEAGAVTWNNYDKVGEFPGITNVAFDKRTEVISRVDFYPAKLSKQEAITHFGAAFVITRYAVDPCLADEDSEPLYESPQGPLVSIEYRSRGIAISVGANDLVTKISYVAGPIGRSKSRCKGAAHSSPKKGVEENPSTPSCKP